MGGVRTDKGTVMNSSLYHDDFVLWTQEQVKKLEDKDIDGIDWINIREEISTLGRSEKQALQNRLEVLLEHLLKRCYVNNIYDNRGWELTIKEQRRQIKRLLAVSPSLKNYLGEVFPETWEDAISDIRDIYPGVELPITCPFPQERLLTDCFWNQ